MVGNHGFVDGNKRTSLLVVLILISRSGYDLILKPEERIDDLVVDVADGTTDFNQLSNWFKDRLEKA